jgi:hypothetical protein
VETPLASQYYTLVLVKDKAYLVADKRSPNSPTTRQILRNKAETSEIRHQNSRSCGEISKNTLCNNISTTNVTGYEFHLIGQMTLKQFMKSLREFW